MAFRWPWRRRREGFEWHRYVRTTIAVRREARREKAAEIGRQTVAGAGGALKATGGAVKATGAVLRKGGEAAAVALGGVVRRLAALGARVTSRAAVVVAPGVARAGVVAESAADILGRRGVRGPLLLAGGVALAAGSVRAGRAGSLDPEATMAFAIAIACLLAVGLPRLVSGGYASAALRGMGALAQRLPRAGRIGVLAFAGLLLVVLVGSWARPAGMTLPALSLTSLIPFQGAAPPISGIARASGAEHVRIDGTLIRLDGIEAPDRVQVCRGAGGRVWRCGESAEAALARLIDRKRLTCTPVGKAADGTIRARCMREQTDIAAELVREGHVLAETGRLAAYSGQQEEARGARRGLWAGSAMPERPADWRARLWKEAAAKAPGGCPIKGKVEGRGGSRTYLMPWSPGYASVRVRTNRGERWLCSEDEARTAGFTLAVDDR